MKHSQGLLSLPCINVCLFGKIPGALPGNSSSCTPRNARILLLCNGSVQLKESTLTPNGDGIANHRALSICCKYCRTTQKCVAFGKKLYWFGYKTTFPVRTPGALWSYQTTPLISILNQILSCVYPQNMIPCTQGCVAWETNVSARRFFSRFTHPRRNNNVIIAPTVNTKKQYHFVYLIMANKVCETSMVQTKKHTRVTYCNRDETTSITYQSCVPAINRRYLDSPQ